MAPVLVSKSQLVPAVPDTFDISNLKIAPLFHVCEPVVKLPMVGLALAPGETVPVSDKVPAALPLPPNVPLAPTDTALPEARPDALLTNKEPAVTVVAPVYKFAPVKVRAPAPILVKAPVVFAPAPDMVSAVDTSMLDVVAAVKVKLLSVVPEAPVNCKVPPPKTRLAAAFVAFPIGHAVPPFAIVGMLKTPALIVVTPV